jgi:hypothetical protein
MPSHITTDTDIFTVHDLVCRELLNSILVCRHVENVEKQSCLLHMVYSMPNKLPTAIFILIAVKTSNPI